MKLYIVRHAKSKRNSGKKDKQDTELSADGIEQARRLGSYFHKVKLNVVYCSPLKRALATLEGIRPYIHGIKVIIAPEIIEHNMGIYARGGKDDWGSYAYDAKKSGLDFVEFKPKKGESIIETHARMGKFYNKLLKKHAKDNILIVGHGIALLHLILNALNLDPREGAYYSLSNASISKMDIDKNGKVTNFHINDYNHLIEEGIKIRGKL